MEILQGRFIAFLQSAEGDAHIRGPPDLGAGERDLSREIENPQLPRLLLVGRHGLGDGTPHCVLHGLLELQKPRLHLSRQREMLQHRLREGTGATLSSHGLECHAEGEDSAGFSSNPGRK